MYCGRGHLHRLYPDGLDRAAYHRVNAWVPYMSDIVTAISQAISQAFSAYEKENHWATADLLKEAAAEITRLRKAQEWQDIASAPKDGSTFLCMISGLPYAARYDKNGRFIWFWHDDAAEGPSYIVHNKDGKRLLEVLKPKDDARYIIQGHLWVNGFDEKPTHWMPLRPPQSLQDETTP